MYASSSRGQPEFGGESRRNQYFVPGEGIAREVITADICRYLDNDATVRPGNYQGRDGYMLYAYRNLTSAMVEDLRKDTLTWEREQREKRPHRGPQRHAESSSSKRSHPSSALDRNGLLDYVDSQTHQQRQSQGPSQDVREASLASINQQYIPGPGPAPRDYYPQQPSPQHESQYGGMPPPSFQNTRARPEGYPQNASGYPQQPQDIDPRFNVGAPQEYGDYREQPYRGASASTHPSLASLGAYPPAQTSTGRPGEPRSSRESTEPRYAGYPDPRAARPDPRYDGRADPRADPRVDPRAASSVGPRADPRMDPRAASRMEPRQYPPQRVEQQPRDTKYERGYTDPRYRR